MLTQLPHFKTRSFSKKVNKRQKMSRLAFMFADLTNTSTRPYKPKRAVQERNHLSLLTQ